MLLKSTSPLVRGREWVFVSLVANLGMMAPAEASDTPSDGAGSVDDDRVFLLTLPLDVAAWKPPPGDLHWEKLHEVLDEKAAQLISIVDRSKVDPSFHLDIEGLRLFATDLRCLEEFESLRDEGNERLGPGFLVRTLLNRRYGQTGVEPDRIPVTGGAGLGAVDSGTGMVLIEGGEYLRPGPYITSQSAELQERNGEPYRVRVASFYMDRTKVTNEDYCRFLNDGNPGYWNSQPWSNITRDQNGRFAVEPDKARWPVIAVNWYQAAGYAEWAGKRLPTEAEWEFAAAGSEGRTYPWGEAAPDETRGFSLKGGDYVAVDAFPAGATPDGVLGLVGNAAEWCADFYSHHYYEKAPEGGVLIDPQGPKTGAAAQGYPRMFKGFCQGREPEFLRCLKRHARAPLLTAAIGFRCVKDAPEPTAVRR